MPLIDSFLVDHTIMPAPSVRLAKVMHTPKGDVVEVWDLRFLRPNTGLMSDKGIHTFEHLFAGYMREHVNQKGQVEVVDISPMGCKTGFYMSLIGQADADKVAKAMLASMQDIAGLPDDYKIPAANPYQCGSWQLHSMKQAKEIAQKVLVQGVGVTRNEDIALDPQMLEKLENYSEAHAE
ncbi:MAG: S-ribosylhomocysteine lyase [Succinivibrio sp.]|nr:S-ribosylhomocysteine lyase [Succinivibrio sp.]